MVTHAPGRSSHGLSERQPTQTRRKPRADPVGSSTFGSQASGLSTAATGSQALDVSLIPKPPPVSAASLGLFASPMTRHGSSGSICIASGTNASAKPSTATEHTFSPPPPASFSATIDAQKSAGTSTVTSLAYGASLATISVPMRSCCAQAQFSDHAPSIAAVVVGSSTFVQSFTAAAEHEGAGVASAASLTSAMPLCISTSALVSRLLMQTLPRFGYVSSMMLSLVRIWRPWRYSGGRVTRMSAPARSSWFWPS